LAGKPLYAPAADARALAHSDSAIRVVRAKGKLSEDDFVEIGRQLVQTARYKEAVEAYTEGLSAFPKSFKLLRHRGHRFLTVRKLDRCAADLLKARALMKGQADVWETDAAGKQTDTYQHQIEYHLGVYYFLMQQYVESVSAFEKSLAQAHDSKEIVGTTDWLYNAYQRNGQQVEAEKLLTTIPPDFSTDREQAYFRRILLYKGLIEPKDLVDESMFPARMTIQDVTKLYGLANWYRFRHGNQAKARELYVKILQATASWPAFAYLAAERELSIK